MNNKLQYDIKDKDNNILFSAYNNIDIDLGLSFDPLSYVVSMQNNKYLHENMLLMNIEDIDSIYNIFMHYKEKYAYQLNNMLFIDSEKNIYPLNYNLENLSYFTINSYTNEIGLNLLDHSMVGVDNFNYQTIFAYNSPKYSYIYSDENFINTITKTTQGLYKIDDNNIKLKDDKVSVNVTKFNYNNNNINTFIDKSFNILNNYKDNIDTNHNDYIDNLNIVSNDNELYKKYQIEITDKNVSIEKKIKYDNNEVKYDKDIIIKDTNYFIIDLPIIYHYESSIYTDLEYNKILCPINLQDHNNFKIEILNDNKESIFNRYIAINYDKSYIHDNHSLFMKKVNDKYVLTDICHASIYFYVNEDVYDYVYNLENLINNNTFKIKITIFDELQYEFDCWIDVMRNQFKKLYHNYNYGFNFENHGDCVGILFMPKSPNALVEAKEYNTTVNLINYQNHINNRPDSSLPLKKLSYCNYITIDKGNKYSYIELFSKNQGIDRMNCNIINKDIFLNFDNNCTYNTIIHDINVNTEFITNNVPKHNSIDCLSTTSEDNNIYLSNFNESTNYITTEQLKHRNFNHIYKNCCYYDSNTNTYSYIPTINIYKKSTESNSLYLLNNAFLDVKYGTLKYIKYNDDNVVNNHYVMDYEKHKDIFNKVYEYKKNGFLKGDFYTPCVQDYLLINLFNIKNYFNYNAYKQYKEIFNNDNYKFLTNQFNDSNNLKEYAFNISNIDNYKLSLYSNDNSSYTYIWPLFRIPDYSIINSNKYIIFYDQENNCECIDYYINTIEKTHIDICCKSYNTNKGEINVKTFKIYDDEFNKTNDITVEDSSLFDKKNNIYKLNLYIKNPIKITKFYVCFIDSESYLNHKNIKDKNYRILCRVYLKNDAI